ncbi:MAG: phosphoenolpyruvate carboxylase [Actinobacteria bacterium]|nr:phosphoenolpyruvate carboxylase [Actinomycetota bacterium]
MRIPTSMATQHPDSASKYIPIQEEANEAVESLTPQPEGLGIEEVMIDFEGKMTPYHQTADVALKLLAKNIIPGKDVWITPRISNATEETVFRQLMALMSIVEADYDIAKISKEGSIREVILPMVKGADDLISLRRRIADVIDLAHKEFGLEKDPNALQIIPLVESIPTMLNFHTFYEEYYHKCAEYGFTNKKLRFMIARSDSALSYGLIPSVLSSKIMLNNIYRLGEKLDILIAPILGGGCLPFRGHITLENIQNVLNDFSGIKTVTIQSGIRYDYDPSVVKNLVNYLKVNLPKSTVKYLDKEEETFLKNCTALFSKHYIEIFQEIAPVVSALTDIIPDQRDRLTPKGPLGYARSSVNPNDLIFLTDNNKLKEELSDLTIKDTGKIPRAISYTGALYSVGLPPEFLGLGNGLKEMLELFGNESVNELCKQYSSLTNDILFAAKFLDLEVAKQFFSNELINSVYNQIKLIENVFNITIFENKDRAYQTLLEIIDPLVRQIVRGEMLENEDKALLKSCMVRLGKLRGSLG